MSNERKDIESSEIATSLRRDRNRLLKQGSEIRKYTNPKLKKEMRDNINKIKERIEQNANELQLRKLVRISSRKVPEELRDIFINKGLDGEYNILIEKMKKLLADNPASAEQDISAWFSVWTTDKGEHRVYINAMSTCGTHYKLKDYVVI